MKRFVVVLAVVLALAGCGNDNSVITQPSGSPSSPPATTPTGTPSAVPTTSATCTPAFSANTLPDTETATGGQLGLQQAQSAGQAGFDRVTFTFGAGSAQPGWQVEYVDDPRSDGSGDPVQVAGSKTLHVIMKDAGVPNDTGVPEPAVRRFTPSGTTVVREVVLDGAFEGQYTAFIGLSSTKPFRVTRLASPPRVVVDVRHC